MAITAHKNNSEMEGSRKNASFEQEVSKRRMVTCKGRILRSFLVILSTIVASGILKKKLKSPYVFDLI